MLDGLFRPRSIAVIGASPRPGTIGRQILANLIRYEYTGFDHPTLMNAIRRARAVTREVAAAPHVSIIATDGLPKDFEHFRDHVHLNEPGLTKLVEIIGPQIVALVESTAIYQAEPVSQLGIVSVTGF